MKSTLENEVGRIRVGRAGLFTGTANDEVRWRGGAWDMGHGSMDDKARMQRERERDSQDKVSLSFFCACLILFPFFLHQGHRKTCNKGLTQTRVIFLCLIATFLWWRWWSPGPLLGALGRKPREVGTNLLLK